MGIDPGIKGGYAFLGRNPGAHLFDITDGEVDLWRLAVKIRTRNPDMIWVEQNHAFPGQGVKSMFTLGFRYGALLGMLQTIHYPVEIVAPRTWKSEVLGARTGRKSEAIAWATEHYPQLDLIPGRKKKAQDGIADAICIAEYGLRMYDLIDGKEGKTSAEGEDQAAQAAEA
jgi:crossover junction endodeoxyribonuclease RuvC